MLVTPANQTVKSGITSKTTIQNLVYQQLRKQFGLSANQAVRVCARVGANRKTQGQVCQGVCCYQRRLRCSNLCFQREGLESQPDITGWTRIYSVEAR
ncbi:hypothetical protein [Microcoleus sp.]|uniref:hypothetical protein n=1 Tax=Microcoleus sp. TaxID=44472 RepID=UPI003524B591